MIAPRPNNPIAKEIFERRDSIAAKPRPLSLAAIFTPQPRGRFIRAEITSSGTKITYQDRFFGEHDSDDWFAQTLRQDPFNDSVEIVRAGISILAGRFSGDHRDRENHVLRWLNLANGESWTLLSECETFWRSMLLETGHKFRAATGAVEITEAGKSVGMIIPAFAIFD